jgi:hypothetical protein
VALQKISQAINEKIGQIEKAITQSLHNDSIYNLQDKIIRMEEMLKHHIEKRSRFDALCSKIKKIEPLPMVSKDRLQPILQEIIQILQVTNNTRAQV